VTEHVGAVDPHHLLHDPFFPADVLGVGEGGERWAMGVEGFVDQRRKPFLLDYVQLGQPTFQPFDELVDGFVGDPVGDPPGPISAEVVQASKDMRPLFFDSLGDQFAIDPDLAIPVLDAVPRMGSGDSDGPVPGRRLAP
jgi:hypothetical protein